MIHHARALLAKHFCQVFTGELLCYLHTYLSRQVGYVGSGSSCVTSLRHLSCLGNGVAIQIAGIVPDIYLVHVYVAACLTFDVIVVVYINNCHVGV